MVIPLAVRQHIEEKVNYYKMVTCSYSVESKAVGFTTVGGSSPPPILIAYRVKLISDLLGVVNILKFHTLLNQV